MGCLAVLKNKKKSAEYKVSTIPIAAVSSKDGATPTTLPEPKVQTRSLKSAPPSFRTRVKPVQSGNRPTNNRARALSAPVSVKATEQDTFISVEYDEHEELKSQGGSTKYQQYPIAQPLPLPLPKLSGTLEHMNSLKSTHGSGLLCASGPLPLPPSRIHSGTLRSFSCDEVAPACCNFSSDQQCVLEGLSSFVYLASLGNSASSSKQCEATATCLQSSMPCVKDFVSEMNTLASLRHPNLCKLVGYLTREGSEERILLYERLHHGSLDRILYGRSDGPPVDWNARMKIALSAAQGLTFLHEEGPFQAMYYDFSAANIQIDKDFSAKLSGYGCVAEIQRSSVAVGSLSVETVERGLLTPKSNVWSFGIILLELLTGRKNLNSRHAKEERNLVKWSRPFLSDDCRLSMIMDPQLKQRFPVKAARTVAALALRCLQVDPLERPTMRSVVEHLTKIQDMRCSRRFPLQEPGCSRWEANVKISKF